MRRKDLIKTIEDLGCIMIRHGGKHDIYHNPKTGNTQPVPRHAEISEFLARRIIRELSND